MDRIFPGLETTTLRDDPDVPVQLHRKLGSHGQPVLLLHGGSARHETFRIPSAPRGAGGVPRSRSLMDWLDDRGYEPWLLDWRGSGLVVGNMEAEQLQKARERLDLDRAAECDVPAAFRFIRTTKGRNPPFGAVAHCLGGAVLSQAIASGSVNRQTHGLSHVVLLTLGLFYEPPLDSRLKLQDHLLERVLDAVDAIDPGEAAFAEWPEPLRRLYARWPDVLRPHSREGASSVQGVCNRLAFMYGTPYLERNLAEEVHGGRDAADAELPRQFGAIPVRMYVHGARNARRGWAAPYDPEDELTLFREPCGESGPEGGRALSAREWYEQLDRVTLVTGDRNQVWQRDSMDRMYEWLRRGRPGARKRYRKVVKRGYGHQDLLWGRDASRDVFPTILEGLRLPPEDTAPPPLPADQASASRSPRAATRSGLSKPSSKDS